MQPSCFKIKLKLTYQLPPIFNKIRNRTIKIRIEVAGTRAVVVVLQQEIFFQSNNCTSTHLDAIRLKQQILERLGRF